MRRTEIQPGTDYAYSPHPRSRWGTTRRCTVHRVTEPSRWDRSCVEITVHHQDGGYETTVPPICILRTWAEHEEMQASKAAWRAQQQAIRQAQRAKAQAQAQALVHTLQRALEPHGLEVEVIYSTPKPECIDSIRIHRDGDEWFDIMVREGIYVRAARYEGGGILGMLVSLAGGPALDLGEEGES